MSKYKKQNKFSLDDKIENTKFDFSKNLKWFLIAPVLIAIVGVVLLCTVGFNLGIDFTGGSTMKVFIDSQNEQTIDSFNKTYSLNNLGEIEDTINSVLSEYGLSVNTLQTTTITVDDLGISSGDAVVVKYQNDDSLSSSEIEEVNDQIKAKLLIAFGFVDESEFDFTSTISFTNIEKSGLVSNDGVTTASASAETLMNSFIALLVAVVIILIYVAFRFEVTSGLAAILALFHDIIITASIVLICRIEINVSFIAALITILGYSINNTIIIFDRMRDERKIAEKAGAKIDNNKIANGAIKSTLSRSVLTTLTTFIMIFMITVIGVTDIQQFAFPIMIGILAGFYSSVFITPGLWAIAYRPKKRKKKSASNKKKSEGLDVIEVEATEGNE